MEGACSAAIVKQLKTTAVARNAVKIVDGSTNRALSMIGPELIPGMISEIRIYLNFMQNKF